MKKYILSIGCLLLLARLQATSLAERIDILSQKLSALEQAKKACLFYIVKEEDNCDYLKQFYHVCQERFKTCMALNIFYHKNSTSRPRLPIPKKLRVNHEERELLKDSRSFALEVGLSNLPEDFFDGYITNELLISYETELKETLEKIVAVPAVYVWLKNPHLRTRDHNPTDTLLLEVINGLS